MSEQMDREMEELHRKLKDRGQSIHDVVDMIDNNKKALDAAEVLAVVVVVLPIAFAASAYAAWLMTYAWGWFIVPLGAPQIGFIHAWGLMTIIAFFRSQKPEKKPDDFFKWSCRLISMNLFRYSLAFGMCFLLHKMM